MAIVFGERITGLSVDGRELHAAVFNENQVRAAAGLARMLDCEPLMELLTVSVAVIDCEPAVFSVALKVCTPLSLPIPVVNV